MICVCVCFNSYADTSGAGNDVYEFVSINIEMFFLLLMLFLKDLEFILCR
jgi:hypothetical protein